MPLIVAMLSRDRDDRILSTAQVAALGYVSGICWYIANCYWIYQTMYLYGGLPKPVALAILVLFSLYLGLYHALFGWLISLMRNAAGLRGALLSAPFIWVAVELARARITGFPWDLMGYSQVDNSVLTLLAPVGGVMMLSFLVIAVNSVIASTCVPTMQRVRSRTPWVLVLVGLGIVAVEYAGKHYRPAVDPATGFATLLQENLAVGATGNEIAPLTTDEKYHQFSEWSRFPYFLGDKQGTGGDWTRLLEVGNRPKSSLIIWPEAPAGFNTYDNIFRARVGELAKATEATVVAGSVGVDFDPEIQRGYREFGSAAVFDESGNYVGRYDKIHRVPWGEYVPYKQLFFFAGKLVAGVGNMDAGSEHTVFHEQGHGLGIFICYESIFGDEVRQFVKNGADVLVNISDDGWYGDTGAPWQHLDMARMRAMENRRWILRDTNTGVTTAIDPHGRGIFTTPRHVRAAFAFPFGYRTDTTFYTRHGDWFAWMCVLVMVALFALSFMRRSEVH